MIFVLFSAMNLRDLFSFSEVLLSRDRFEKPIKVFRARKWLQPFFLIYAAIFFFVRKWKSGKTVIKLLISTETEATLERERKAD